jgi:GTP cyclohydrolase I
MKDKLSPKKREQAALTRFPTPLSSKTPLPKEEKIEKIALHIRSIMEILGLDVENQSLKKTPERVASMYVNEVFSGLDLDAFPSVALFEQAADPTQSHQMVFTRVSLVSFCEHHLVPMIGSACIAYLPKDKIIGLSKLSRIARYFAARPQLQERLTSQIGDSLSTILGHNNVAVCITAKHSCVIARGAKDESAETTTLYTDGLFYTSIEHRKEFLDMVYAGVVPE